MAAANNKKLLGDQLVEMGAITREQLWEALRVQSRTGEKLGRVLIKLGFVMEEEIAYAVDSRRESPANPDPGVLRLIPEQLVKKYKAIPLRMEGKKLVVAMADPANVVAVDDLRLVTGAEIEPVRADIAEIDTLIQKYFDIPDIDKDFDDFDLGTWQPEDAPVNLEEENMAHEAPIIRLVNKIIIQAIEERASDIHIEPREAGVRVRYRIDGVLREAMQLPQKIKAAVISRIKIMSGMDIAEKRVPQDGRIKLKFGQKDYDLRVSTLPAVYGEKVVTRILDKSGIAGFSLEQLGFLEENLIKFRETLRNSYGMVLVTGPTGSGKTTTLYAAVNQLNDVGKNIITVEDPVEYVLDGINQTQVNVKAGMTFAAGLRAILRQDPDIIMVGEIRDRETAEIAVRAANTGHLVLSTMHTNDAPSAVTRLVDMGIEPFLVASSVLGVAAQRLVRVICPHCREAYNLPENAPERKFMNAAPGQKITLYRGKGCGKCSNVGYLGRLPVNEVMPVTSGLRSLILGKVSADKLRRQALAEGMIPLKQDGIIKAARGLTTIHEVMRVAYSEY